jgi:signal transduction histidine kinase
MTERNLAARKIDQYQKRLRSLSSQLSLVEARERRKIASELHDNLGQDLVLAKFRLKSLLALPTLALRKRRELDSIGRSIDSAIRFARSLTARVSPLILYRLDFESSVEWLAENVLAPCHIACEVRSDELPETFGEDAQVLLFESVRELFVNVVKHAGAGKVKVVIENEDGRVRIRVQDDGKGFPYDPDRSFDDFSGFGLFSIRERIKYLDGDVIISSSAEQGTSVQLVIPPIFLSGGDGL